MSLEEVRDWHRVRASAVRSSELTLNHPEFFERQAKKHDACADAIDAHFSAQPTNTYERAVIEQAMVTECVNIEGRNPTDIIRDIISWHVDMDRGARNVEQPKAATDAQVDVDRALDYMRNFRPLRNALDTFDTGDRHDFEEGLRAAIAHPAPSQAVGAHPDDLAVDAFADAMKEKLAKARAKGRGGWNSEDASNYSLSIGLRNHVLKGDPVDVANFAMFLHQRGESILSEQAVATAGDEVTDAWRYVKAVGGWETRGLDEADFRIAGENGYEIQTRVAATKPAGDSEDIRKIVEKAVTSHCNGGDLWLSTHIAAQGIAALASPSAPRVAVPK
jgi:hypothetical protein